MLRYLILVIQNLFVTAVTTGMLFAYVGSQGSRGAKRVLTGGALFGIAAAVVMAVVKNTTSKIHTGYWNFYTFTVYTLGVILFIVMTLPAVQKKFPLGAGIAGAIVAAAGFFYTLPDVMTYPYVFNLNGASVLSTAFFGRFAGWIFGLITALLIFLAHKHLGKRISSSTVRGLLDVILVLTAGERMIRGLDTLRSTRVITDKAVGHNIFVAAKFVNNNSNLFIYLTLLISAVIPVLLFVRSYSITEPYKNSAERRKLLAANLKDRRWAVVLLLCCLLTILCLTWFTDISSAKVELSPIEDSIVKDDAVYVSFDQVSDGHLHRFAWISENGVEIRFIVIKKPNSSSYGIGLDACDICGETGYYEKNGKIVCKLCDVVMNINTIGFKGGCNPKVIDYSIKDGYIIVPISALLEHEKDFK